MKVLKDVGVVIKRDSRELKLQKIKNDNKEERLALVTYKDGMSVRVMDIEEEYKELRRLLEDYLDYRVQKADVVPFSDTVRTLSSLPAMDMNFKSALESATAEEIQKAIEKMEADTKGKHATRIKACKSQLDRISGVGKQMTMAEVMTPPTEDEEDDEDKPKYIYPSADKKPKIIPLVTEGKCTYEDCVTKFATDKEIFIDSNSLYIIDGLLELCKVDQQFRNNVMRKDKSYGGFMEYMFNAARNGYCITYGNVSWCDNDLSLGLAIDYFNADLEKMKEEEKKRREEEAKKRKAEADKKKKEANKNGKKKTTTRKKKGTTK